MVIDVVLGWKMPYISWVTHAYTDLSFINIPPESVCEHCRISEIPLLSGGACKQRYNTDLVHELEQVIEERGHAGLDSLDRLFVVRLDQGPQRYNRVDPHLSKECFPSDVLHFFWII